MIRPDEQNRITQTNITSCLTLPARVFGGGIVVSEPGAAMQFIML